MTGPTISIFYCADGVRFGGFVTDTAHLIRALRILGASPRLYMVRKKVEPGTRDFGYGISYQNVSIEAAEHIARTTPSLIECAYWKKSPEVIERLLLAGATLKLHDPTEFHHDLLACARTARSRVFTPRRANVGTLRALGLDVLHAPHAYVQSTASRPEAKYAAVLASRIDFDKHIDIAVQANALLPPGEGIVLFGRENPIYTYHKLGKDFPGWRQYYAGSFPKALGAGARVYSLGRRAVDMSAIKGDGGGTQYTFLEAFDARRPLILSKAWRRDDDHELEGAVLYVDGPAALADAVRAPLSDRDAAQVEAGARVLAAHSAEAAGRIQLDALLCVGGRRSA